MKATGIVRRIDDLGRVVIPKEIRRTLRIREGDPLEIFTSGAGEVIFKKYSPLGDIAEFSHQYAEVLNRTSGLPVIITDRDRAISAAGISKKETIDKNISKQLRSLLESRSKYIKDGINDPLMPIDQLDIKAAVAYPIISSGDIAGSVILIDENESLKLTDAEIKLTDVASAFLGKQMEQ